MTIIYTKSLSTDFENNFNSRQFHNEIIEESGITTLFVGINISGDDISLVFESTLSTEEEILFNNLVDSHNPEPIGWNNLNFVTISSQNSPYKIGTKSVLCDTSDGDIIIELPKIDQSNRIIYGIKKISALNNVIIDPHKSEQIDESATKTLTNNNDMIIIKNNSDTWFTVGDDEEIDQMDTSNIIMTSEKGDILVDNGMDITSLSVGSNNNVLMVDSNEYCGLKWDYLDHSLLSNIGSNTHTVIDSHIANTNNPHSVTKTQIGLGNVNNIKYNMDATSTPSNTNDNSEGYTIGSMWIDTNNDNSYVCVDSTTDNAVWIEMGVESEAHVMAYDVYDSSGNQTTTGTMTVNLDNERKNTGQFSLTNDEVTIGTGGTFIVIMRVSTDIQSGTSRTSSKCWLERNTGSGYTEVPGSCGYMYNRTLNNAEDSATVSLILDLNSDDKLRVRLSRITGSSTLSTISNGSSLTLYNLNNVSGVSGGEVNTASNIGVGGVGVYKQKSNTNLEFKTINGGSNKIFISNNESNNEINIDVVESNINISNLGGSGLDTTKIANGSVSNTEFEYLNGLSKNIQTQINDHILDTSTHGITGNIVGTSDIQTLSNKSFSDHVAIGANASIDDNAILKISEGIISEGTITALDLRASIDATVAGQYVGRGLTGYAIATGTNYNTGSTLDGLLYGIYGTGGTAGHASNLNVHGLQAGVFMTTGVTMNINNAYGGRFFLGRDLLGDTGIINVSDAYVLKLDNANNGLSATNHYGLYIDEPTNGTNNYTIYTTGGTHRFGGNLDITGNITISGTVDGINISDHTVDTTTHGVVGSIMGTTDTQTLTNKNIDSNNNTITNISDSDIKPGAAIDAYKIADGTVSNTKFQYLSDITSDIQTQLNNKSDTSHNHSLTGDVVGTTDIQTLTNKTISATNNTISGLTNSDVGLDNVSNIKVKLDGTVAPTNTDDINSGYTLGSRWIDTVGNKEYVCVDNSVINAIWTDTTGTGDGEANTTSNVGTSGVGVYKQKIGVNFEFKNIGANSNKIYVTDDTENNEVKIDVVEGYLNINNLSDAPTGDVVGTTDTQTMTNKTLTDSTTYFQDNTDNTKKMQFQLSGITTGSTRTMIVPDANTTLLGTDTYQTITHKNIDSDNNTITNITNADIKTSAAIDASKIADGLISNTEYQYLNGLNSNIQSQIDTKIPYSETNLIGIQNAIPGSSNHILFKVTKTHPGTDDYNLGVDDSSTKTIASTEEGTLRQALVYSSVTSDITSSVLGLASSNNSGSSWNPKLVVQHDGKIGIGKNNPTETLDINGNIAISGTIDGVNISAHASASNAHNLMGNIVGTSDTQTLTNKTIDAYNNTLTLTTSKIVSTNSTSTTSSTYTLMNGMTTTPSSGTYMITFSTSGNIDGVSVLGSYALFKNGSVIQHTTRNIKTNRSSNILTLHTQDTTTVNGSETIEIKYKTASKTFTVYNRSMLLLKIG